MLVLESEERARGRGATILAELAGTGWSFDATDDTAPDAEGQSLAMTRALRSAGVRPEEVSYVNAHGTSTQLNDKAETAALVLLCISTHQIVYSKNRVASQARLLNPESS